jgi:hypothetical protein
MHGITQRAAPSESYPRFGNELHAFSVKWNVQTSARFVDLLDWKLPYEEED